MGVCLFCMNWYRSSRKPDLSSRMHRSWMPARKSWPFVDASLVWDCNDSGSLLPFEGEKSEVEEKSLGRS